MKADRKFWYRWMLNYSIGELLGIGAATTIGRFLFMGFWQSSGSTPLTYVILIAAGTCEGLIIGYIQWRSLSKLILHFNSFFWIAITTLSAIAGWLLVLPPSVIFISFFSKLSWINNYYSVLYISFVGIAFGGIVGVPQFFILKKFYKNAFVWIIANVVGWSLSFLMVYSALSMFTNETSFLYNLLLIVFSCIFSGLVQAIVTGTSLHFLMSVKAEHEKNLERTT